MYFIWRSREVDATHFNTLLYPVSFMVFVKICMVTEDDMRNRNNMVSSRGIDLQSVEK